LVVDRRFTATATIALDADQSIPGGTSGLLGIAARFGLGSSPLGLTPAYFAEVLRSRTIAEQLLQSRFPDPRPHLDSDSLSALDILVPMAGTPTERLAEGVELLGDLLDTRVNAETGTITISLTTPYATLSANAVNRIVALLSDFNITDRRTGARQRREFIQQRLVTATDELRVAEDALESFLTENRQFESAPHLRLQYERLQRDIAGKQEVLLTLLREYETARVEEANDVPALTVIDSAVPPTEPSAPRPILLVSLAVLAGGVLAIAAIMMLEFGAATASDFPEDVATLRREIRLRGPR
jgi:uncharacterized protein involved in exopolysaccharide biosynthesis